MPLIQSSVIMPLSATIQTYLNVLICFIFEYNNIDTVKSAVNVLQYRRIVPIIEI